MTYSTILMLRLAPVGPQPPEQHQHTEMCQLWQEKKNCHSHTGSISSRSLGIWEMDIRSGLNYYYERGGCLDSDF